MRAPLLAAVALLALPGLPPPADVRPSHEAVAPYMHLAALNIPAGIRPGAWLQIGPSDCTASFVVRDAAGALYITTAAHCTHQLGEVVRVTQGAPVGLLAPPLPFGKVVARWPMGIDAALVAIDADQRDLVDPRVIGWGGPTGLATAPPAPGTIARQYGWGWWTWMDHATRCRTGLVTSANAVDWVYTGPIGNGDSGSAVLTADGLALGIVERNVLSFGPGPYVYVRVAGTRFDLALAALEQVTGLDLELVTGGPVSQVCEPELPV